MDPKDAQENSTSFDTNLMGAVGRRKKLYTQNRPKNRFKVVGIAQVELKSKKPEIFVGFLDKNG